MKYIICFFILLIGLHCHGQSAVDNGLVTYETVEYAITYPKALNFNEITAKCEILFCTAFEITKSSNDAQPKIPFIALKISDCSSLGIGTAIFEKELKNKESNYTKITRSDNSEYFIKKMEIDDFVLIDYVCIKNMKVYTLQCLTEMKDCKENNAGELIIMNTFSVK